MTGYAPALLVLASLATPAFAQADPNASAAPVAAPSAPSAPADAAAPPVTSLKVTVVSASGPAQKLLAGKGETTWEPLQVGEELSELTVIRTGLGAKVVLRFEDMAEVTVNSATKVGLGELRRKGDDAETKLGLKYGTVRASIRAGRGRNDFRVATPVATLSVRGSGADIGFQCDSSQLVIPFAGNWQVSKQLTLAGLWELVLQQNYGPGQTGTVELDLPILLTVLQNNPQLWDKFGLTPQEVKTLVDKAGGRWFANTPTGSYGLMSPTVLPLPTGPDDEEPGWP